MKVRGSQNCRYKILLKNLQHLQKVSIGVDNKKVKKKSMSQEKKESKNRSKKQPKAAPISEVQPQVDVFHQTYHLNQGDLEEDHPGIRDKREMRHQTFQRN